MATSMNGDIKTLSEPLTCPQCEQEITSLKDIQNAQPVKKGNLIVCSNCGTICKVGDSNLVKITKKEMAALDPQSRHLVGALALSVLAQIAKEKGNR